MIARQHLGKAAPRQDAFSSCHHSKAVGLLEIWPETPILPKQLFSRRRLSMKQRYCNVFHALLCYIRLKFACLA